MQSCKHLHASVHLCLAEGEAGAHAQRQRQGFRHQPRRGPERSRAAEQLSSSSSTGLGMYRARDTRKVRKLKRTFPKSMA